MKRIAFVVAIEFEDSINDDNEINEIAKNIAMGLVSQVNHEGLVPENSETFTKSIEVSKDGVIITTKNLY